MHYGTHEERLDEKIKTDWSHEHRKYLQVKPKLVKIKALFTVIEG